MQQQLVETRKQMLARRRLRLGATDVAALFGISPYKTAYEVWLEKKGMLEGQPENEAMALGNALEPGLLDLAERKFGQMLRQVPVVSERAPIASTCDGILTDGSNRPVEIKTAGLTGFNADVTHWGEPGTDQIPDWYLVQVHTQLLCTGSDRAFVLALIGGRGLLTYHVDRDDSVCDAIIRKANEWWNDYVVGKGIPDFDPPPSVDVLKRMRREPESVVDLDHETSDLVAQLDVAKFAAKEANKAVDELKAKVLVRLGDCEAANLPDGRRIEYFQTSRAGYTVEPTTFRTLRVKKAMK